MMAAIHHMLVKAKTCRPGRALGFRLSAVGFRVQGFGFRV